ncbi:MAG: polysulfide reductase NrfD [Actinobacteria bacterium]|nr:polysulfide reductase NrfD [Actinomycetota bacterium]
MRTDVAVATASKEGAFRVTSTEVLRSVRREWGWPIALYLYLAGTGAGSFVVGVLARTLGPDLGLGYVVSLEALRLDLGDLALLWGPLIVAAGAPFLILDLGRRARFFRAGLNAGVSWMARGFYVLSAFIGVGLLGCALAVIGPDPSSRQVWVVLAIGVPLALATATYTGILLRSLKFVPTWRSYFLPVLFLISALSTGSMGIVLAVLGLGSLSAAGESATQLAHAVSRVEQLLIVLEGSALAVFLFQVHKVESAGETSVRMLIRGRLRLCFWGGIVGLGLLFPIVLELLYQGFPEQTALLWIAGITLLAGGFLLRIGVLAAATKEELPLQKLLEARAHWRGLRTDR